MKKIFLSFGLTTIVISASAEENYTLPFEFATTKENFNQCVVVDANDDMNGNDGVWSYYLNSFQYTVNDNSNKSADDWIILPSVDFGNASEVTVSFVAKVEMEKYPEAFEVYLGKSQEKEAMTLEVGKESGFNKTTDTPFSYTVAIPSGESSEWCLGFHAVSDPGMFTLYIKDIKIVKSAGGEDLTVIPAAPEIVNSTMDYLNYTATVKMPAVDTKGATLTGSMTLNVMVDDETADSYSDLSAGEEKEISLTLSAGEHTIAYQAVFDGQKSEVVSETVTATKKVIVPGVPTVADGKVVGMSYTTQVTMPSNDTENQPITEKMSLKVEENEVVIKSVSDLAAGEAVDLDLSLSAGTHTLSFYAVIDGTSGTAVEKEISIEEPVYGLPFSLQPDEESIKECLVIDANGDGNAAREGIWSLSEGAFCYKYSERNNADDWVILPFVETGETRNITVSVNVKTGGSDYPESFELKMGEARDISSMTEIVMIRNEFSTNKEYQTLTADITLPESAAGKWALGIHAISAADMNTLSIKDIEIYATSTEDEIPAAPIFVDGTLEENIYTASLRMPTEAISGVALAEDAVMTLKVTVDDVVAVTTPNLAPGAETEVELTLEAGRHIVLFSVLLGNSESETVRKIVTVKKNTDLTGNLPYTFNVTQDSFDSCIVVDVNSDGDATYGKGMWTYQFRGDAKGGGSLKYFSGSTDADDWIILPMVNFGESKVVTVSLNVETESDPESFEVYLGRSRTVEGMTLPVMKYSDYTHQGDYATLTASVNIPEDASAAGNEWCLGIRATSPADHYVFYINNIKINQATTTGIDEVETFDDAECEYYSLQGVRIQNPEPGSIVIVKKGERRYKAIVR